jgi:hypothetical protein
MAGRFERSSHRALSPFFAFQDIITSAVAILITVVMLMALDLSNSSSGASAGTNTASLREKLRQLLDTLGSVNTDLRGAQEAKADGNQDPSVLRAEINSLNGELDLLVAHSQADGSQLNTLKNNDVTVATRAELEKKKASLTSAQAEVAKLEKSAAESLDQMNEVEGQARDKEAQLLAEEANKNQIWLIPERSEGSKEPVLAVVSNGQLSLQRFDDPKKQNLGGQDISDKFQEALKQYSNLNQYIVFYFKPSGAELFDDLTTAAKDAGFEIGYDAVGEDTQINFGPVR